MNYEQAQLKSGIKVGDKVRVLRTAEDYENGWNDYWVPTMDKSIGNIFPVISISDNGIELDDDNKWHFNYPYFVLEKVDNTKSTIIIDGETFETTKGIANSMKELLRR